MKISTKFILGSTLAILISCNSSTEKAVDSDKNIEVIKTEKSVFSGESKTMASIEIDGMTCAVGCAKRIENGLSEMTGIVSASVDFDTKVAKVEFDDSKVNEEEMIQMIQGLGEYSINKVEVEKTVVKSSGGDTEQKSKNVDDEATVESVSHRNISFPNIFDAVTRLYRL